MLSMRSATLAAASGVIALATLIGSGGGSAYAIGPGCTSVNGSSGLYGSGYTYAGVANSFEAGDIITITENFPQGGTLSLKVPNGGLVVAGPQASNIPLTYTFAANASGFSFSNSSSLSLTITCTHPVSKTNTDSQNIRSLQTSITPLVATTSGAAITGAIDGGIADGFSNNGTPTSFGPNGGFINFAAEPRSQTASRAEEAFAALGYAGNINKAPITKAPPLLDREWSAWADIRGTGWKANETSGNGNDLKGNQLNLTAGLGRKLTPDMLVGLVVGYEHFKYDVAALAGSLKGDGETVGGYFARRFGNLRFDAALAWSNVNYSATAGTATGSFTGSRWLASSGLTGNYKLNAYVLEPSAKLYVLWEREKAWTDSLGTLQDARNFSAGRTALGTKVARPFEASGGWMISPYAGLYGDWRFSSDNALPVGTPVANVKDGWSGRVTSGVSATATRGAMISLGGELGGLGASYKIWSGNVRGSVPF